MRRQLLPRTGGEPISKPFQQIQAILSQFRQGKFAQVWQFRVALNLDNYLLDNRSGIRFDQVNKSARKHLSPSYFYRSPAEPQMPRDTNSGPPGCHLAFFPGMPDAFSTRMARH